MKFDKKIFLSNMEWFLVQKNIKSRELEEAANVSKGYISRLCKEGNQSIPGIDFLLAASELFEIGVESLSTIDYVGCSESEAYYVKFLERLRERTEAGVLAWKNYSMKDFVNKIEKKIDEELIIEQEPSVTQMLAASFTGRKSYVSKFEYGEYTYSGTEGDFFELKIDKENTLYMVKVRLALEEKEDYGIEMFMITNHTKKANVCCSSPETPHLHDSFLNKLYNTVKDSINKNALDKETKRIIDDFMYNI